MTKFLLTNKPKAMSDTIKKLQLLPKGAFTITTSDGVFKGRFSMVVLDRFCEEKGIGNYLVMLEKISFGFTLGQFAELILMAHKDYYRGHEEEVKKTKKDVMDMVDEELDGAGSADFISLVKHAIGRVADLNKVADVLKPATAEEAEIKKNGSATALTDLASGKGLTRPD